jgi:hypothetical protein
MRKNNMKLSVLALVILTLIPFTTIKAQDEVEASVGTDVVSSYVWRGQKLGGFSVQPYVGIDYKGFSLSAWGNVGVESTDDKEIDFTLAYSNGGFSLSLTDYWVDYGTGFLHFAAHDTDHVLEAQIGYDFDVVAINWYTNIAGADGVNADGKRAYSSYVSLTAPFSLGGIDWTAEIGATPWANDYYGANGFSVQEISLMAEKEIEITENFSLPIFAKLACNPATEDTFFVFGLSF